MVADPTEPIDFFNAANVLQRLIAKKVAAGASEDQASDYFVQAVDAGAQILHGQVLEQAAEFGESADRAREEHRGEVRQVWGKALELHLMFSTLAEGCTTAFLARRQNDARTAQVGLDPRLHVLCGLQARMSRLGLEVHDLLLDGFPRAALARARTAHELAVFAELISTHGAPDGPHPNLAQRYTDHALVQRHQDAIAYSKIAPGAFTVVEMTTFRAQFDLVLERHGRPMTAPHGWAVPLFPDAQKGRPIPFGDLEELAGLANWKPHYRWANHEVHATARSLVLNTTISDEGKHRFGTGREIVGLGDPSSMVMASTLHALTSLLLGTGEDNNIQSILTLRTLTQILKTTNDEIEAASLASEGL